MAKPWIKDMRDQYYSDEKNWAKLSTGTDKETGQPHIEVYIGLKGDNKPYDHMALTLDQALKFITSRGVVYSLSRKVESEKKGLLEDKKMIVDAEVLPQRTLVFKVNLDGTTGEVTISEFKFT